MAMWEPDQGCAATTLVPVPFALLCEPVWGATQMSGHRNMTTVSWKTNKTCQQSLTKKKVLKGIIEWLQNNGIVS